jgi:hypothetical protein
MTDRARTLRPQPSDALLEMMLADREHEPSVVGVTGEFLAEQSKHTTATAAVPDPAPDWEQEERERAERERAERERAERLAFMPELELESPASLEARPAKRKTKAWRDRR